MENYTLDYIALEDPVILRTTEHRVHWGRTVKLSVGYQKVEVQGQVWYAAYIKAVNTYFTKELRVIRMNHVESEDRPQPLLSDPRDAESFAESVANIYCLNNYTIDGNENVNASC